MIKIIAQVFQARCYQFCHWLLERLGGFQLAQQNGECAGIGLLEVEHAACNGNYVKLIMPLLGYAGVRRHCHARHWNTGRPYPSFQPSLSLVLR